MITYNSVNLIIDYGSEIMANVSDESEMKECEIELNDGRIIQFTGKFLTEIDDSKRIGVGGKELESIVWRKYKLYKTISNQYIFYKANYTRSNIDKEKYKSFPTEQELVDYAIKKDETLIFVLLKKTEIPIIIKID